MIKAEKFQTQMLGGICAGSAFDLDLHANDHDKSRVIFSFDSKGSLDKFTKELVSLMDRCGCWSEIESINGIIKER